MYLTILILTTILILVYIIYTTPIYYSKKTIETLENKHDGYITKIKSYHRKNIARPLRLKKNDMLKKLQDKYDKLKKVVF